MGMTAGEFDAVSAGLCASCIHARVITSDRGSTFLRCDLADRDPLFPKYPRLPVLRCSGWSAAPAPRSLPSCEAG
jgi:hypothetical protein